MDQPPESSAPASRAANETNVKETIESILIAFILAFMFRAFVVEAFVIPTGSMAPTLLGAHLRYTCEDCGFDYEVNYQSSEADDDDVAIPATARLRIPRNGVVDKTYRVHCPNCGHRVPRAAASGSENDATSPPVHYGDRILVLKYLYLFHPVQRWDVVVFKSPYKPAEHQYQQNYIKRLVGKPNESILILDGDIYVSTKGRQSTLDDFVVQTKPRWAQEALWRVVFDNDYQPRGASRALTGPQNQRLMDPPFIQPWTPSAGEGWDLSGKRVFTFDNLSGAGALRFNADANPHTFAFTDHLAYDITVEQNRPRSPADTFLFGDFDPREREMIEPDNAVSDVKLAMYYQRTGGDGPLRLSMKKLDVEFIVEITPAQARLTLRRDGREEVLAEAAMPTDCRNPAFLELMNVDYQVTLRVNNKDLLVTTPQQYAPDKRMLMQAFETGQKLPRPTVEIAAERQSSRVSHLSLWRDVFYTTRNADYQGGGPLRSANPFNFPERVMHLGADEYFTCGDNSLISLDGRYWEEPIDLPAEHLHAQAGVVPDRFLLGKAFFVYWPAGFRPIQRETVPSLIPNFGKMRFIH